MIQKIVRIESLLHSAPPSQFPHPEIENGKCLTMHSNSYILLPKNIAKKWLINKSSKQFAFVSPASIPDRAFYRVIINQRGLLTEKNRHNMQISPLDLLMHNGRKKKAPRKRLFFFQVCVHEYIGVSGGRSNGWTSGWEQGTQHLQH